MAFLNDVVEGYNRGYESQRSWMDYVLRHNDLPPNDQPYAFPEDTVRRGFGRPYLEGIRAYSVNHMTDWTMACRIAQTRIREIFARRDRMGVEMPEGLASAIWDNQARCLMIPSGRRFSRPASKTVISGLATPDAPNAPATETRTGSILKLN